MAHHLISIIGHKMVPIELDLDGNLHRNKTSDTIDFLIPNVPIGTHRSDSDRGILNLTKCTRSRNENIKNRNGNPVPIGIDKKVDVTIASKKCVGHIVHENGAIFDPHVRIKNIGVSSSIDAKARNILEHKLSCDKIDVLNTKVKISHSAREMIDGRHGHILAALEDHSGEVLVEQKINTPAKVHTG